MDDIRFFGKRRKILDERGRRLFAANEAMAHGYGGVMATSGATGWRAAQSTAAGSVRSAILRHDAGRLGGQSMIHMRQLVATFLGMVCLSACAAPGPLQRWRVS